MPVTILYLKDHEGKKEGTRAVVAVPVFIKLKKAGIAKRVLTTPIDKEIAKKTDKKVSGKSLKNLVSGKKGKAKK